MQPFLRPLFFSDIFRFIARRGYVLNKSQRRALAASKSVEVTNKAMEVALLSLEKIEAHEKECGERWAEAVCELKYLREATAAHSARWEKLAWLVLGSIVATAVVHLADFMI